MIAFQFHVTKKRKLFYSRRNTDKKEKYVKFICISGARKKNVMLFFWNSIEISKTYNLLFGIQEFFICVLDWVK